MRVESNGVSLSPEDRRKRNSKITLFIGKSSLRNVRIPWLSGLNLADASEKLTESSLSIGYVEFGDSVMTSQDSARAIVVRQYPSSSSGVVKAGTSVDLVLNKVIN